MSKSTIEQTNLIGLAAVCRVIAAKTRYDQMEPQAAAALFRQVLRKIAEPQEIAASVYQAIRQMGKLAESPDDLADRLDQLAKDAHADALRLFINSTAGNGRI